MEQPQSIGRALGFGGRLSFDTATLGGLDEQYDKLKDVDVSHYCLLVMIVYHWQECADNSSIFVVFT